MTQGNTTLSLPVAIRIALAGLAAATVAPALAQDGAPATTDLDRIEVTGSRIRQVDVETAAPVLMISRDEIEKQGFSSVADILQNITAAGSPPISRTTPLASGEAVGGQSIDLRDLGPARTLVLVNGKRLGITTSGTQDVSTIPAAMVERVEVLKDGASTIYGSDAIAGVVNIITRKNFEGAEANAYLGQYSDGDGTRQIYDFVLGFTGERGSVTAGIEYTKEDPVWARDRWFAIRRFPTSEKTPPRPGGLNATTQFGRFRYDTGQLDDDGNPVFANRTLRRETPGLDPRDFASYRALNGSDVSNPAEQSTVLTGIERKSVFVNAHLDISEKLAFESDILYTDRDSFAQNAGFPFQSANFDTPMSIDSYYNPLGNQAAVEGTLPPGVPAQAIQFVRRGWEVPREVRNSLTTFRFTGTFSGSFELADNTWDWDAGYLFNQNKGTQIGTGNLNTVAVRQAMGPSFLNADGVVQCGTPDAPIPLGFGGGQCTPWNPLIPFGSAQPGDGSASDANVRNFIHFVEQALSKTETVDYFANLTGTLLDLPAGGLGVAVGVEHRREDGAFSPDALAQTGISTGLASGPTAGSYSLDEIYAELQIPVLADLPGAQELSLNVASRYSDYDTFGDTTNHKFGFKWRPIDSLLVRGTWAEGFRAPDVSNLFGGAGQSFAFYTDPCDTLFGAAAGNARCLQDVPAGFRQAANTPDGNAAGPGAQTPIPFIIGSNDQLTPELSESKTLGIVYSPEFVDGLNLALDWWDIRIDNTIIADSPTQVLDDCYLRGIEARCNAATGSTFVRDATSGAITSFLITPINAGFIETEGYDLDVSYRIDTRLGRFGASWLTTYVSKNDLKVDDDPTIPPQAINGFGGNFRIRSNLNLSWQRGAFGASWGMRYYSGVKEPCFFDDRCNLPEYTAPDRFGQIDPQHSVGSVTFNDVQARWNAPWNATVAVGANNVFERYGPVMYSQPNSGFSYYGGYDIGRFVYLKYQQRF